MRGARVGGGRGAVPVGLERGRRLGHRAVVGHDVAQRNDVTVTVGEVRRRVEQLPIYLRSTYGGNTTCVEVQTPDELLILDCGSGIGSDLTPSVS